MTGLVVMALVLALAVIAPRYGVDTRDGRDWSFDGGRFVGLVPAARRTVVSDARALANLSRGLARRLALMWDAPDLTWRSCWRDELHWRVEGGGFRLCGRMLPLAPPEGNSSARPD